MGEIEVLLKLEPGQSARFKRSRTAGFMGNVDIDDYDILDADGNVVATAELKDSMQVRGFESTKSWRVMDLSGTVIRRS